MKALELRAVDKRLGRHVVLSGASCSFAGPGVLVVSGENGTGKSTLLRLVAGVLQTDAGQVFIAGASIDRERVRALGNLGYAPEAADLPERLTVRELTALVAGLKRCKGPDDAIVEQLDAGPLLDLRLGSLSLGQRRRALVLAALVGDPLLLALDEPSNGLDAAGVAALADLLQERTRRGRAAIIATHDTEFAAKVATERLEVRGGALTAV